MKKILLQTTIPSKPDDWTIDRFSVLANYLSTLTGKNGERKFDVVARNREDLVTGDDALLSRLDHSDFDQVWLFGVDVGNGLTANDCDAIGRFRARGGAILTSRDHQDLGISFCTLGGIGKAHHFHSKNQEEDLSRRQPDDTETPAISWPNYHSGRNGDYQFVESVGASHPVLQNDAGGLLQRIPAHPHEGAISVPSGTDGRVIATGKSAFSGRAFNIAVAFEGGNGQGRGIADSSFHHFLDYNLDPSRGCPSFVTEEPGKSLAGDPQALKDTYSYFRNLAEWLSN